MLSPPRAALFLAQGDADALDASVSRHNTVSPQALKAVLQAAFANDSSTEQQLQHLTPNKEYLEASKKELLDSSPARSTRSRRKSQQLADSSPARSTRAVSNGSSGGKRPRKATTDTTPPHGAAPAGVNERRKSSAYFSTDSLSVSNLQEDDGVRRSTLDPSDAALVVAALQLEAEDMSVAATATKTMPASEKQQSIQAQQSTSKTSPPATTSSAKRRTTLDPSDVLLMQDGVATEQPEGRRQTIDKDGLLEMNGELGLPLGDDEDSARKRREESSRKRAHDVDEQSGDAGKRSRVTPSDEDEPMHDVNSVDVDSSSRQGDTRVLMRNGEPTGFNFKPTSTSPPQNNRRKARGKNQRARVSSENSADENRGAENADPMLMSPPATGTQVRTPLKGILSARKGKKVATRGIQITPNKSVNFGPSQGAEFNHGSPSTSMTPMCAKEALRLFPLDPPASSEEEEPDDAETSLNSSILDEADSRDEGEAKDGNNQQQSQEEAFNPLQRRTSLHVPKPTEWSRRRNSLRGYSPLDNQAEARRRRRKSINVARQTSSAIDGAASTSWLSPSSVRQNSFLSAVDAFQTTRSPYADSSASSDPGEDMDITGDYSDHAAVAVGSAEAAKERPVPLTGRPSSPLDDDTSEFSLGNLLAESAQYSASDPAPELPGSLSDLANEGVEASSSQGSQFADTSRRLDEQDTTLDPILEEDEGATSSHQSMMSLESSDESDAEYDATRKSLAVNLSSKFDRVGAFAAKNQQESARASYSDESGAASKPFPSPKAAMAQLITMEELLSSVDLDQEQTLVDFEQTFFGSETGSPVLPIMKDVKLACAYDKCSEVVERHAQEISSWSSGLTEELTSLLHMKASSLFGPKNLDDVGREAIQELFGTEAMVARSGWCQLRAQMEKQLIASLSSGASALANDVKSLKTSVSNDALKRQHELAAIQELIKREEQMGSLLDAIEEQQDARNEYAKAVEALVSECSSLSLEDSVLQSRLNVIEGRAAELEPVTSEASTLFEQEVLATEELLAIQESLSVWRILEATSSCLRLGSRFEDVLFDVEMNVEIHLGSDSAGQDTESVPSTSITAKESLKRRKRNTYLPMEGDVVLLLQRLLLHPRQISQVIGDAETSALARSDKSGRLCSKLQALEHFLSRSFRLLKELRELSTHFAMQFDADDNMLWIEFIKFPSTGSPNDLDGAQFHVGFSIIPVFPHTTYQTAVRVAHGKVCSRFPFAALLGQRF
ncbi:hypothetical protein BBJ28_00009561 [Nothophytophthora sp. Chile5]|nr:hypothetical protein BBJ28_00009561 [Nothophytophthora sp. Chile5]